ncbi:MAG: XdhC family protein [Candidatus Eremiobacteraeota bacterium]|nr:XdhC family protein [Candidatus Eremiobacteraeota bacterium]
MNDLAETIAEWHHAGERVALATVINVEGSAPRSEGAKMVISASGKVAGSVSGGCVESAVVEEAIAVMRGGTPTITRYGINRNMMWDVGLSCGGAIDVFVEPLKEPLPVQPGKTFAVCTIVRGPKAVGAKIVVDADGSFQGKLPDVDAHASTIGRARQMMVAGQSKIVTAGQYEIFIDVSSPGPHAILVGAVHIAVALCQMATQAGYAVTVIDPRETLCNRERFPLARALLVAWPHDVLPTFTFDENTYVAVLTHDEKFDDPTLEHVLPTRARYVGAIGSKKTQALRRTRLLEAGLTPQTVERLRGPIGLDIGAQSPEEIAVAILAEMIAAKYQRTGMPLRDRVDPHIHA